MNRQQKEQVIESLKNDFETNPASFVVGVQGLTVSQLEALRGGLREKGGKLKVAKVRLAKKAVADLDAFKGFDPVLKEQLGFVFTAKEASPVAKVLHTFSKENKALELVAGMFENEMLDRDAIIQIAALPSREELLTMIARVLNEPVASLARALQAVSEKKAEGAPEEPAVSEEKKEESTDAPVKEEEASSAPSSDEGEKKDAEESAKETKSE